MDKEFYLDDISFWVKAFSEFGIDLYEMGIFEPGQEAMYQIPLTALDDEIEQELQKDAKHQMQEWIINDRAYEAFGLIESDGPNIGRNGRLKGYAERASKDKDEPFINLVKSNVDRVVSHLEMSNLGIYAIPNSKDDAKRIQALNDVKESILGDNHFDSEYKKYIRDGVTLGSGILSVDHGPWMDNPDLSVFTNKFATGEVLTQEEFAYFKKAVEGHKISYVPTFELIRYRGAKGRKGQSIHDPVHRWIHRIEQVPVAQLRNEYPNYAQFIKPIHSRVYSDTNPEYYLSNDLEGTATKKTSHIKLRVNDFRNIPVEGVYGTEVKPMNIQRYAVAKVVRIEGLGIVDIDIDEYNHHRFPYANWVYSDSYRHSCGIGIVKYGRDPQVVHNKLHRAMLDWIGSSALRGGFVDSRLGLTEDQLNLRNKPGRYVPVSVPDELQGKSLKDLIVDQQPPTFPSAYAELMGIESQAIDSAMNVPNVYKGIGSGSSGLQEQILQQQADMAHNSATTALQQSLYPLGILVFSNIQQFEKDPMKLTIHDEATGEDREIEINMPKGWYIDYEPGVGEVPKFSHIENDITSLMFKVTVSTRSIVPDKPLEKAQFYNNFFTQTAPMIGDPKQRAWLRGMNKHGYNLEGISETLDEIDEMDRQEREQHAKLAEMQQQLEEMERQHEQDVDNEELAIEKKKMKKDFYIEQQKLMIKMMGVFKDMKQHNNHMMAQGMKQLNPNNYNN